MNSINIHQSQSALETVNLEEALQQGRRLRSRAFTSFVKSLFAGSKSEHDQKQGRFSPDYATAA
ncbi:MAG: hypothetical protein AAGA21_20715 [Pseudomonadota bacterium]